MLIVLQCPARGDGPGQGAFGIGVERRSGGPSCGRGRGALAVEVELDARVGTQGGCPAGLAAGPEVAEQVDHRRGHDQVAAPSGSPQRARTCCSNWLTDGRLDGQVPGVVRPGGDLVDQQAAVGRQEELDASGRRRSPAPGPRQGQRRGPPERQPVPTGAGISVRVEDVPLVAVQADRIASRRGRPGRGPRPPRPRRRTRPSPRPRRRPGPGWPTRPPARPRRRPGPGPCRRSPKRRS